MSTPSPTQPAGWYPDGSGVTRYWDGVAWTQHTAPPPAPAAAPIVVQQQPVRQSRDRAQYTRQQKGHSLTKHLLFGIFLLYIPTIYYAASPNHYFHA